jgi:hypothetical protein
VRRFETHLLHVLGRPPASFLLLNDEDRVVLSTDPRRLVGELLLPGAPTSGAVEVPGTPWRLLAVERTGVRAR